MPYTPAVSSGSTQSLTSAWKSSSPVGATRSRTSRNREVAWSAVVTTSGSPCSARKNSSRGRSAQSSLNTSSRTGSGRPVTANRGASIRTALPANGGTAGVVPVKSVANTNARSYPSTETAKTLGCGRPTNRRFLAARVSPFAPGATAVWNVPSFRLAGSSPGIRSGRRSSRAVAGLPRNTAPPPAALFRVTVSR